VTAHRCELGVGHVGHRLLPGGEACGVPRRNVELLTGGAPLQDTTAVLGVREWLRSGKTFCLLAGGFGVGKTTAAAAVLTMARKVVPFWDHSTEKAVGSWSYSDREGLFVRAAELSSTSPYADEGRGKWNRVRRVAWLVVDDLGMERMDNAGIWSEQFDLLMDCRYSQRLKTILSTNLDKDAFDQRYGGRVMDRVQHDGEILLCGSESMRRPQ
jgi:DNA replication protein DnaC